MYLKFLCIYRKTTLAEASAHSKVVGLESISLKFYQKRTPPSQFSGIVSAR